MTERNAVTSDQGAPDSTWSLTFICLAAIFSLPVISIVFLTSWHGNFSDWQNTARMFFLPALYAEIIVIIVAVAKGLRFSNALGALTNPVKILAVLWLAALCGSTAFAAANPNVAILGAGFWIVHSLFAVSIFYLIKRSDEEALHLEILTVILSASAAVAGLAIFGFAIVKGFDAAEDWIHYLPGFAHLRHTGYIFAPAIAASIAHLAASPSRFVKTHLLLLALNSALLLWLGSRGPVFGLMVAVAISMACFPAMRSIRFLTRAGLAAGCGALLSIIIPLPQSAAFGALQRFWNTGTDPVDFSPSRLNFWAETIELIGQRPFTGHGPMQFQFVSDYAVGIYKHPHSSVLQFLFDWGFIGGLSLMALIAFAVYFAFSRSGCSSYVRIYSAMGFSTMAACSLIDGLFFYPYTIAISTVFLIMPLAFSNRAAG